MKTIITMLLTLCMFGSLQGQDRFEKIMDEAAQKTDSELSKRIGELLDNGWVEAHKIQQQDEFDKAVNRSIIRLWDRYEKECRKDSTDILWIEGGGYDREVERIDYLYVMQKDLDRIIIKRAPNEPTPQGFIEWLKKQ